MPLQSQSFRLLGQNAKAAIKSVAAPSCSHYSSNVGQNNSFPSHIGLDFGSSKINVAIIDKHNIPKVIHKEPVIAHVESHLCPENTVLPLKHFIARNPIVHKDMKRAPFNIASDHNGNAVVKLFDVQLGHRTSLLQGFLGKAKEKAESYFGKKVSKAVITHPSVFGDCELREMVKAGLGAGFELVHNIDETSATAIAYGMSKREKGCLFVVVDMGFRNFDLTLLEVSDSGSIIFKWPTKSDMCFGGEDFDIALYDYLLSEMNSSDGTKRFIRDNNMWMFSRMGEQYKKIMSSTFEIPLKLPLIMPGKPPGILIDIMLTRSKFESVVNPLIERMKKQIESYMDEAGTTPTDVDEVLLVGGMARVPKIRKVVSKIFGKSPSRGVENVDEVVALGAAAAVQAGHFGEDPWNSN